MGKLLIINDADFSKNAIGKIEVWETIIDKDSAWEPSDSNTMAWITSTDTITSANDNGAFLYKYIKDYQIPYSATTFKLYLRAKDSGYVLFLDESYNIIQTYQSDGSEESTVVLSESPTYISVSNAFAYVAEPTIKILR